MKFSIGKTKLLMWERPPQEKQTAGFIYLNGQLQPGLPILGMLSQLIA